MKLIPTALLAGMALIVAHSTTRASECGSESLTVLRAYGVSPGVEAGAAGIGQTAIETPAPSRNGGTAGEWAPTLKERTVGAQLLKHAVAADEGGNRAGCDGDLAQAKSVLSGKAPG